MREACPKLPPRRIESIQWPWAKKTTSRSLGFWLSTWSDWVPFHREFLLRGANSQPLSLKLGPSKSFECHTCIWPENEESPWWNARCLSPFKSIFDLKS